MTNVIVASTSYFLGTIGVIANSALIFVILKWTPSYLKGYSQIMLATSICDTIGLLAMMGGAVKEVVFGWACGIEYSGPCTYFGAGACALMFGMQCEMYSTSVMMMCFSFYYRYCLLQQVPHTFMNTMRKLVIPSIVIVNIPLAATTSKVVQNGAKNFDFVERYRTAHPSAPELLGVTNMEDLEGILLVAYVLLSSFVPFVVSIILRRITIRRSQELNNFMSISTLQMHTILVKVLNTQLLTISCFFVGSSFFLIDLLELPYLREISILAIPLINLQNICTPIANICIITPYRRRVLQFLTSKSSRIDAPPQSFSLSTIPH